MGMMPQPPQPMGDPNQQGGQMQGAPQAMPGPPPDGGPAAQSPQPDPSNSTYGADQQTNPQDEQKDYVNYALTQANLAKKLSKTKKGRETLQEMGQEVITGYEADEDSRKEWCDKNKEWMKLALLVRENKTFPWPKASNVKYPLLATAAMQFTARAYPALVPSDGHIVKTKIVQANPQDQIYQAAEHVSQHMSYQVMERIPDWEENMDKLLMSMAISGICFKKTYCSELEGTHRSSLVYPENLVVNYHAKTLESAYRKTEILRYNTNEVQEKINNDEEFLDVDLSPPVELQDQEQTRVATGEMAPPSDKSTPHVFLACHTFWDLDDDGYEEPYIIVVHQETKEVVRIQARWCMEGVKRDADKKIICIEPMEYFTAFPFIPNPEGSIYALGFGLLLGPLNEAVNSIINQLVDAGTLNNMQSGFLGKGLRLRMGTTSLQPGEFKVVNATAEDLQKGVFVMPTKEPSNVLFQLMNMLVTSGNQLASIAEIFVGKMPGQNTPATTTQETIQQGMAVFTAIYKRVYRSLAEEFRKIYFLNKLMPDLVEQDAKDSGIQVAESDYDLPPWVIIPGADPTGDSNTVRQAKLDKVGSLLQMGTIDPMVYTRLVLDVNEIPNAQQLIRQPQPQPPDPKAATEQAKQQTIQAAGQQAAEAHGQKMEAGQAEIQKKQALGNIAEKQAAMKVEHEQQMQALKLQGAAIDAKHNTVLNTIQQHHELSKALLGQMKEHVKTMQDMHASAAGTRQELVHTQAKHTQTLTLAAQAARQKAKQAKSTTT